MALEITQVDAFTTRPFAGNPAAVCVLDGPRDEGWMQLVAREMNTGGTAFLEKRDGGWNIRFFTPTVEVELSGHTTLSAAQVLWESGAAAADAPVTFFSPGGELTASCGGEWIELEFPAMPDQQVPPPPALLEGLGISAIYVGRNAYDYLVVVDDEATVRELRPDFGTLLQVETRRVMVTARGDGQPYDFISRFFAPAVGLDEDHVTGSAHCCLGPFWAARLGKTDLLACQASPRGGELRVAPRGERVRLAGQAVTVLRGKLIA